MVHNALNQLRSEDRIGSDTLSQYANGAKAPTISTREGLDDMKSIRFNVFQANGGRVIEIRRNDMKNERTLTALYVITSDQNFGEEIDKIITMESLKA